MTKKHFQYMADHLVSMRLQNCSALAHDTVYQLCIEMAKHFNSRFDQEKFDRWIEIRVERHHKERRKAS